MRVFGHHVLDSRVKLFVGELASSGVLYLAALSSVPVAGPTRVASSIACASAIQSGLYLSDLYDPERRTMNDRWLRGAGLATILATIVWTLTGRGVTGALLVATSLSLMVAWLLRGLPLHRPWRVLVHGTGPRARVVARVLETSATECVVVGYLPEQGRDDGLPLPSPMLLDRSGEPDRVAQRMNAEILVAAGEGVMPEESLVRARAQGIEVLSAASFCARFTRRLPPELLAPSELVVGEGFFAPRWFDRFERALDIVGSIAILLPSMPLLLGAMAAVKLDSPGPVLYRQQRVGRGGRTYFVTKLRSMRIDAEAGGTPVWAGKQDPRITSVGRILRLTRLDELPQLFSVLRGDMSLVGPRPERPYFVDQLKGCLPLYGLREAVRPGLTGWAQISYPYGATIEDARAKLEYDLYFIRHRSPFLALNVLFHTVRTVITGRGAR